MLARAAAVEPRGLRGARVAGWTLGGVVRRRGAGGDGLYSHGLAAAHPQLGAGYAKVFDFRAPARVAESAAHARQVLEWAFTTEAALAERCAGTSRVVRVLGAGRVGPVRILIFERAVGGVRDTLPRRSGRGREVCRVMADVARGLREMHDLGIVHQDVKAANILAFSDAQGTAYKLADLGRAAARDCWGPFAHHWVVGDAAHAPPELLRGDGSTSWKRRGLLTDAYLLGALACELVLQRPLTGMLRHYLGDGWTAGSWRRATREAAAEIARRAGGRPGTVLAQVLRAWCEPDPARRAGLRRAEWVAVEGALHAAAN